MTTTKIVGASQFVVLELVSLSKLKLFWTTPIKRDSVTFSDGHPHHFYRGVPAPTRPETNIG